MRYPIALPSPIFLARDIRPSEIITSVGWNELSTLHRFLEGPGVRRRHIDQAPATTPPPRRRSTWRKGRGGIEPTGIHFLATGSSFPHLVEEARPPLPQGDAVKSRPELRRPFLPNGGYPDNAGGLHAVAGLRLFLGRGEAPHLDKRREAFRTRCLGALLGDLVCFLSPSCAQRSKSCL